MPFRTFHSIRILEQFFEKSLPLDLTLRCYFRNHKAIGSHDRKEITELIYKMIRWQGLIDFLSQQERPSWEERLLIANNLQPETYLKDRSIPIHHRVSFPKDLFTLLVQQLGEEHAIAFCLSSNQSAPITIRVNTQKISREKLFDRLSQHHSVSLGQYSPLAIQFAKRVNFLTLPEFQEGLFEVQDEASQLAALQVRAKPGEQVLDYCAGSGGKSLTIALQMDNQGQIYLHDIRSHILTEAKKRLKRAGIHHAQTISQNHLPLLRQKMHWVLTDVPCSGLGTLRRNPDMKWRFSLSKLQELIFIQKQIVTSALAFVKPGGHLVYVTCSILPEENEKQIQSIVNTLPVSRASTPFSSSPIDKTMDGLYAIVLQKT